MATKFHRDDVPRIECGPGKEHARTQLEPAARHERRPATQNRFEFFCGLDERHVCEKSSRGRRLVAIGIANEGVRAAVH